MADKTSTLDQETQAEAGTTPAPKPAPQKFAPGMVVDDRFELSRELGAGGFGQVFLATDKKRKQEVALKILQLKEMSQRQIDFYIDTFQAEFRSLTKLKHPNLCQVYDFGKLAGNSLYYFTSEFVSNAQDLMKATEKMALDETIELFVQLCRAVGYVHSHGLVHYDLKPANILVQKTASGQQIKLVDFGLATPQQATLKATAGSLLYMSPEVLQKERVANHRSDLYALGIILFQLLTRQHPFFECKTKDEIINAHLKKTAPRLGEYRIDLEPFWQEIVDRLMAKLPEQRYSSATTVLKKIHLHHPDAAELPTETKEGILGYTFSSELIGRDSILDQLKGQCRSLLEGSSAGPPGTSLIVGEKGTGKTRILEEIKHFAQLAGHHVIQFDDPDQFETDLYRELNLPLPSLEKSGLLEDDSLSVVQGWTNALLDKVRQFPTLVLIDDAHLYAKKAQLFFTQLIQAQKTAFLAKTPHAFVLLASSQSLVTPGLSQAWTEATQVAILTLANFSEADVALYLKSFTGLDAVPQKLTRKFYQATSGNPFFLTEILKSLIESNQLFDPSGLEFRDDIPLPSSISNVLQERFLKNPPLLQTTLRYLAASIRSLSEDELATLLKTGKPQLGDILQPLTLQGFVQQEEDLVQLANPSLRQAILEHTPPEQKKKDHQALATLFLQATDKNLYWIAYHLVEAHEERQAASYALRASDYFRVSGHLEQETQSLTWALQGLEPTDPKCRISRRRLAQIFGLEGNYQKAQSLMNEQLATPAAEGVEQARDLRTTGWLSLKQKKYETALDYFLKARERLNDPKHSFDVTLLNDIGNIYLLTRKYPEAKQSFEASFAALQKEPLQFPVDLMNNKLAVVCSLMGQEAESAQFLEEKKRLLEKNQTKNQLTLAMTESELGYLLMRQGKYAEAIPHLESCLTISEQQHFLHNVIKTLFNLTQCLENENAYAQAIGYAQKQLKYASNLGTVEDVASSSLSVATLYTTLGVHSKAEPLYKKALELFQSSPLMTAWTQLSLAGFYSEMERYADAKTHLKEAMTLAQELKDNDLLANLYYAQAEVELAEKNKPACLAALQQAEKIVAGKSGDDLLQRLRVVRVKLAALSGEKLSEELLTPLIDPQIHSAEIQIESWMALMQYWKNLGDANQADTWRSKARLSYEQLSKNLPEEYQDTFRRQKRFASLWAG